MTDHDSVTSFAEWSGDFGRRVGSGQQRWRRQRAGAIAEWTRTPLAVDVRYERARRRDDDQGAAARNFWPPVTGTWSSSARRWGRGVQGGSGYNAAKSGTHAVTRSLRLELLGEDVRVTEVLPGAVRTEFGLVRFEGDEEKAEAPYKGIIPLTAEDVAECVRWTVTLPPHVNVDRIDVRPVRQGGAAMFAGI